jgi:hypothetical protein
MIHLWEEIFKPGNYVAYQLDSAMKMVQHGQPTKSGQSKMTPNLATSKHELLHAVINIGELSQSQMAEAARFSNPHARIY